MSTRKKSRDGIVITLTVGYLKVDYVYQREPNRKRVAYIADNWDPAMAREILVSKRKDGSCYIIDGQHTAAAAIAKYGAQHQLRCRVLEGLTLQEEAELFYRQNESVVRVGAAELYRARLTAEEPTALAINLIVTKHGLRVTNYGASGVITAIAALESVHTRQGTLDATLGLLKAAWGDRGNRNGADKKTRKGDGAYNGMIMKSVGCFVARYPEADTDRLAKLLQKENPVDLLAVINSEQKNHGGAHDLCGARVLRGRYNRRLRDGKLPMSHVFE